MAYRGPDDQGYFSDNKIELAHNRLSIIDLSEKGHQPMHNEDKTIWLVFNGEIYNFVKLKEELLRRGHTFLSKTDAEVIIHAYEEYGISFLQKLDGMFSFAIYDNAKKRLLVVRDRIGVKPLYYTIQGNKLLFSSEIKALLADAGITPEMNQYSLKDYFKSSKKTQIKGVYEIMPAHYMDSFLEDNKIRVSEQICYWKPNMEIMENKDETHITNHLRALLEESVKQRMVSDVPLALFFSGGIDSTILAFFAKKYHNNVLKAFTIGTKEKNEFESAKKACNILDLEYIPIILEEKEIVNIIPTIIYHLEGFDPRNVELCILSYYLAKMARGHGIKVVLCGEGADELFCGYRNFFPGYFKGGEYSKENIHKEMLKWTNGLNSNHLKNKDRGTMAFGLELRLPYIDHLGFFQYAFSIDPCFKIKDNQEKYILRKIIREDEIPKELINKKKTYFHLDSGVPFILNRFFGLENKGSLNKRFEIYKKIFEKIFVKKEDYNDIDMKDYGGFKLKSN